MLRNNIYLKIFLLSFILFSYPFSKLHCQNLVIDSITINSGQHFYFSPGTITSPDTSTGPVVITGNSHVDFKAVQYINLKCGFSTDLSSGCGIFHAFIGNKLPLVISIDSVKNVTCYGGNDGYLKISSSGGSGNLFFYYSLSVAGVVPTCCNGHDPCTSPKRCTSDCGCQGLAINNEINSMVAGKYNLTLFDSLTGEEIHDSIIITEPPAIIISASSNSPVCLGSTIALSSLVSGGTGNYTFAWLPETGLSPNAFVQNPFVTPLAGTTIYTLTVSDGACSATTTTSATSGQVFICTTASIESESVCSGTTFSVTAHSTGGGTPFHYLWNDGVGGTYPDAQNISLNLSAGQYTFDCTITDDCGDASLSSVTVIVNQSPSASITPLGPLNVCSSSVPIQLTANTDVGNMYQWSRNGIDLNGQTSSALSVSFSGTYNVTVTQYPSGTWTQKANIGGVVRYHAPGFSIGNKGYCGLGYNGAATQKDFWEYDPSTDTWTQKADFGGTSRNDATGFSIGDKGYIGLGVDVTGERNDFWEYDPISNSWTQRANFGGVARGRATGFGIGTIGYIGMGETNVYYNDFWEYNQATDMWTQMSSFPGTPRGAAVGFSIGSKGYIGTGWGGSHKKDFWEYDPLTNTWIQKADFGGIGREFAAGFSIGNKGYIGTGADNFLNDFWEYNPSSDTWIRKADFAGSARYAAFGFSIGNKGYIGAGRDNLGIKNDFWEFNPGAVCSSSASDLVTVIPSANPPIDVLPVNINASVGATSSINFTGSCSPLAGPLDWYDVPVGGTLLSSTSSFNPITNGGVNTAVPGVYNFYAECVNGSCSSTRTHVTFTVVTDNNVTLSANIFLEGYYIGSGLMNNTLNITGVSPNPLDADTIFISVMNPVPPYEEVDRQPAILKTNGDVNVTFSNDVLVNSSYYLKVSHRNSVETWSKAPVVLSSITTYSFSSSASQAFGDNEVLVFDAFGYAIYSGDINQDGAVDGSDFLILDPFIQSGDGGYAIGDLNGDGAVDGSDFLILDPNIQNGIGANIP